MKSLKDWVEAWDRSAEPWSVHVDELDEWRPETQSFADWTTGVANLWAITKQAVGDAGIVVAVVGFEASERLETFDEFPGPSVDFFTPPSLYLLRDRFGFSAAGEQYFRVLTPTEFAPPPDGGMALVRSARSLQSTANRWAFDNALYITSSFLG